MSDSGAAALVSLFHSTDPRAAFSEPLDRSELHAPGPHDTWEHALDGRIHLWFEVVLGSPQAYREYLKARLDERTPIPYVREAAAKGRLRLEGATHVDALLLNEDNGVSVLFEAKVFREHRRSRLYGWLLNDYREHPSAIGEDLPHRASDWHEVSRRIGWATFEDCRRVDQAPVAGSPSSHRQCKYARTCLKLHGSRRCSS